MATTSNTASDFHWFPPSVGSRAMGGVLAPSLRGTEKTFAYEIFEWTFLEKMSILTPKISDDLSFLVIGLILSVFSLYLLSEILYDSFLD